MSKTNDPSSEVEGRIHSLPVPSTREAKYADRARLGLAIGFSATYLAILLMMAAYCIFGDCSPQKLAAVSSALLAPLGALVGGIVGFYFGAKKT